MILIKTTQAKALAALQSVLGIVERRHTLPILGNVLLRQRGATLGLTTSDLELQLHHDAELGGDGSEFATTVDARKLAEILRAMPPDQLVTLTADAGRATLRGGRSRFALHTLPAADFPLVAPPPDLGPPCRVPQALLKDLIDQVAFAMAVQDIRYFLNGVLFIAEGRCLRLVATDGNRLAHAEAELDAELPRREVILPRKAVHALQQLLRDDADAPAAELRFGATQALFGVNGVSFVSRLIEGRFPDFRRVIPTHNDRSITLGRAPFLAGLQRAAILTSDKFRGIRLSVSPGRLRIASSNAAREEADEDLDVDYGGAAIDIGFNVGYLVDLLSKSSVEQVRMELLDASSSALFTFPGRAGFKYVVSPMRL